MNINILFNEIIKALKDYDKSHFELILVNDGSSDDTERFVKNLEKHIFVKCIYQNENHGQSYSIHNGIKNSKFDTIVTLDGDGQNDPKDINKLLNLYFDKNEYSLISGIRIVRKDSYLKIISSKVANKIRSHILKDNCPDTGCSLKVFDKNIFLKFPYFNGIHRFIPALFIGFGFNVSYVPVNHRLRLNGNSKYGTIDRLIKGIKDLILVKKIIKNNKKYNL